MRSAFDQALQEQRFDQAVQLLEPFVWRSDDAEGWNNLGVLYARLGWLPEADAALRRTLQFAPAEAAYVNNLADLCLLQDLPYSAMNALQAAIHAGASEASFQPRLQQLQAQYPVLRASLYTPGFASEDTIERCLRSMQAQSYPIHELLLVDDRSPDRSTEIALRHGVRVVYHQENVGLAASCNTALQHCTGDFLAKIDSDVELSPTWLERAMLAFLRDGQVGGVGGRLIEYRTATVADRWRRIFMKQHWGPEPVVNPSGLYGADCIFRVSALRAVGGWNPHYRTNFEDMDLSGRLQAAGWKLFYDPKAWARHLRQDRFHDILRNFWNWYYPPAQDHGLYDSISQAAQNVARNGSLMVERMNLAINNQMFELTYPTFVLYFWCCLRDLQQVVRRNKAPAEVVSQTGLALLLIIRQQLARAFGVPPRVTERVLVDLAVCARGFLRDAERDLIGSETAVRQLVPRPAQAPAEVLGTLQARLPHADLGYLEAFLRDDFLGKFSPIHGAIFEQSLHQVNADEQEHGEAARGRAGYVLFNPPFRAADGGPDAAAARWLFPSPLDALAQRLRAGGARVLILDALAQRLDLQEAHERILGMEPAAVIYCAAEGGMDRILASARQLKLLAPNGPRLILTGARGVSREELPHFDAIHPEVPEALPLA